MIFIFFSIFISISFFLRKYGIISSTFYFEFIRLKLVRTASFSFITSIIFLTCLVFHDLVNIVVFIFYHIIFHAWSYKCFLCFKAILILVIFFQIKRILIIFVDLFIYFHYFLFSFNFINPWQNTHVRWFLDLSGLSSPFPINYIIQPFIFSFYLSITVFIAFSSRVDTNFISSWVLSYLFKSSIVISKDYTKCSSSPSSSIIIFFTLFTSATTMHLVIFLG